MQEQVAVVVVHTTQLLKDVEVLVVVELPLQEPEPLMLVIQEQLTQVVVVEEIVI